MANFVNPDQTAPIGAVRPGSTLFASILKIVNNVSQLFAADDFSIGHFQMHFSWHFCTRPSQRRASDTNQQIKALHQGHH